MPATSTITINIEKTNEDQNLNLPDIAFSSR
jgi:hypothetical protein